MDYTSLERFAIFRRSIDPTHVRLAGEIVRRSDMGSVKRYGGSKCVACLALFLASALPGRSTAEVFLQGTSILGLATAQTLGCNESDGGGGATQAQASCSFAGYAASASAEAEASGSTTGGQVRVFAEASASSVGGNQQNTASGVGTATVVVSWQITSDTQYSVESVVDSAPGGGTAGFTEGDGTPLPASGLLPAGFYALRADASAIALAEDRNGVEVSNVGPFNATARVVFAPVDSPSLLFGKVTSRSVGVGGLELAALVGGNVVATTRSGDDGGYLIDGLPGAVEIRVSDPTGQLPTALFGPVTPPARFDIELTSPPVPILSYPTQIVLAFVLAGTCMSIVRRLRSPKVSPPAA